MWRFRLRLLRDLRVIKATNADICKRVEEMTVAKEDVDKKEKDEVDNNFEPEMNFEPEVNAEAEMNFEPEVNAEAEETIEKSDKEQEKE